jgi:hypothetical protein
MYVEIVHQNMLMREYMGEENRNSAHDVRMIFKAKVKPIEEISIINQGKV